MCVTFQAETDSGLRTSIAATNWHSARTAASTVALELAASVVWRRWLLKHMRLASRSELGDW
jgi:hypothetical protein